MIAGALVAAFVGYVLVVAAMTDDASETNAVQPVRTTTTTVPARSTDPGPTAHDEAATHGGDGAPHEAENRGQRQPGHLTEAERRQLDAEGRKLVPALDKVRTAGAITPAAVTAVLVAADYPADHVGAVPRTLPSDGVTQYVVFGVEVGDACCRAW